MQINSVALLLTEQKYKLYALKLTRNKDDADDLISELILKVYEQSDKFIRSYERGDIESYLTICIRNAFYNRKKEKPVEIDEADPEDKRTQRLAEKIISDQQKNDYYPLMARSVAEFGSVDNLAKATGISKFTIYTGLRKYKSDLMNLKKLLLVTPHQIGGVGYHRILKPFQELSETRNDIHLTRSNAYVNRDHDIVVFNRIIGNSYKDDRAIIGEAKICGQKVICDVDDYWVLPSGHMLENFYKKTGMSERIAQNIKEADLVTCTHEVLALRILKLNKNVVVIPNAINEADTQWISRHIPDKTYRFGFVGSEAHTTDVPILRKGCNLINRSKMDFKFIYVGWSDSASSKLYEQVFTSRGTSDRYGCIAAKPVTEYGLGYNLIDCSLAPLEDTLFNRCKSNLKILEAAAHGLPIICSKIHPYFGGDFDVLFAENEYDWYKQMGKLIRNPADGVKRGEAMRSVLLDKFTYKKINKLREEIL